MPARDLKSGRRGQTLILVSFALIPMFGLLGLVVDLGWMEFVKMSAQKAADAAAMAAILQFQSTVFSSSLSCGVAGVVCQSPTSCSPAPANYLHSGCLYAGLNGFAAANVTLQAGLGAPPTSPGVNSSAYWVTARVNQSIPQLFSAVMGNRTGFVAARATASVSPARGCIYVMDPSGSGAFAMNGSTSLVTSCGVFINSNNATALTGSGGPILRAPTI